MKRPCFTLLVLELGGEIWLGKIAETGVANPETTPDVFKFQGYFGFNPVNPLQNYAYFRQSGQDMTLENFCRAFDIPLDPVLTPEPLKKSGFYGEQVFSYTAYPDGKQ